MSRRHLTLGGFVVLLAAVAIISRLAVRAPVEGTVPGSTPERGSVERASRAREDEPRRSPGNDQSLLLRLRSLEGEVEQLRNRPSESDAGSSDAIARPMRVPMTPEAAQRRAADLLADRQHRHEVENIDGPWASRTEPSITRDMQEVSARAGFRMIGVECRTTSCMATVEWGSYDAAHVAYERVVTSQYAVNCSRRMILPAPTDPSRPYLARLFFSCNRSD